MLKLVVNLFRGEQLEPSRRSAFGVSSFALFPQDKEGNDSEVLHGNQQRTLT